MDSELQNEISIKKNLQDEENKYRVTIGHGSIDIKAQDISELMGVLTRRIYNFASQEEIHGITMVGLNDPLLPLHLCQKNDSSGEFEYSLKYISKAAHLLDSLLTMFQNGRESKVES